MADMTTSAALSLPPLKVLEFPLLLLLVVVTKSQDALQTVSCEMNLVAECGCCTSAWRGD